MEQTEITRIEILEQKIDAIYTSVEKTRKIILWTAIVSIALFVLPLIGIAFALPSFMNNYVGNINALEV
jgi:type IV secretory pathway component VirB8